VCTPRKNRTCTSVDAWTCDCVRRVFHPPATGKVLCLYAYISGVSLRTLPCTLTRRRFPIFRPKLSTEKPRPSNPPFPPSHPPVRPRNPLSASRRLFLSAATLHIRGDSYATSSRHIRTKSNVSRLNGFVSAVHNYPPLSLPPTSPPRFSCRRRGRNIYYKSNSEVSTATDKRKRTRRHRSCFSCLFGGA